MKPAEAGWFVDESNGQRLRYFDGKYWTDRYRSLPGAESVWEKTIDQTGTVPARASASSSGSGSAGKIALFIGVAILVLVLFQSCIANQGWRMGVDGNGYQVTCEDGTMSMSGGKQGACSHHGGVR